jgi:hypothetical protein
MFLSNAKENEYRVTEETNFLGVAEIHLRS